MKKKHPEFIQFHETISSFVDKLSLSNSNIMLVPCDSRALHINAFEIIMKLRRRGGGTADRRSDGVRWEIHNLPMSRSSLYSFLCLFAQPSTARIIGRD